MTWNRKWLIPILFPQGLEYAILERVGWQLYISPFEASQGIRILRESFSCCQSRCFGGRISLVCQESPGTEQGPALVVEAAPFHPGDDADSPGRSEDGELYWDLLEVVGNSAAINLYKVQGSRHARLASRVVWHFESFRQFRWHLSLPIISRWLRLYSDRKPPQCKTMEDGGVLLCTNGTTRMWGWRVGMLGFTWKRRDGIVP